MKDCTELIELISAHADGELTEPEKREVENHLAVCENCSTHLDIYREISASVSEFDTPVPDALRIGVMNRVLYEDIPGKTDNVKKRGRFHFAVTRFAPIAACLVAGLIVWQNWGTLWGAQNDAAVPAAAPAPMAEPATGAPSGIGLRIEADVVPEIAFDEESDDFAPIEAAPAPMEAPENLMMDGQTRSEREAAEIMRYIEGASSIITVTGELPAFLAEYEPQDFGSWFGWEMVYEIPSSEVPELMVELRTRNFIEVTESESGNNSTYAVVLYSPGE